MSQQTPERGAGAPAAPAPPAPVSLSSQTPHTEVVEIVGNWVAAGGGPTFAGGLGRGGDAGRHGRRLGLAGRSHWNAGADEQPLNDAQRLAQRIITSPGTKPFRSPRFSATGSGSKSGSGSGLAEGSSDAAPSGARARPAIFPADLQPWSGMRAVVLPMADQYQLQAEAFSRAVTLDPLSAEAHYRLGFSAIQTGELERATKAWDTFLRLSPNGEPRQLVTNALGAVRTLSQILAKVTT